MSILLVTKHNLRIMGLTKLVPVMIVGLCACSMLTVDCQPGPVELANAAMTEYFNFQRDHAPSIGIQLLWTECGQATIEIISNQFSDFLNPESPPREYQLPYDDLVITDLDDATQFYTKNTIYCSLVFQLSSAEFVNRVPSCAGARVLFYLANEQRHLKLELTYQQQKESQDFDSYYNGNNSGPRRLMELARELPESLAVQRIESGEEHLLHLIHKSIEALDPLILLDWQRYDDLAIPRSDDPSIRQQQKLTDNLVERLNQLGTSPIKTLLCAILRTIEHNWCDMAFRNACGNRRIRGEITYKKIRFTYNDPGNPKWPISIVLQA